MKLLFFIIVVCLIWPSYGSAQDPKTRAEVTIQATVMDHLEMITLANCDVGTVVPSEGTLRLNPRTDSGAGIIKILGRPATSVQVTYSSQVQMVNVISNTELLVTYAVSGNKYNDQSASEIFTTNPQNVILNNEGEYYLYIGCEFSMENLVSGQYDGDFVIEVDY